MIERLNDDSGYSMVEVLAAIVILSLAILPMVGMFDAGLRAASTSGNYDKARALANSNLEAAKADLSQVEGEACPIEEEGPLDNCMIETEPVHIEADSDSASFDSGSDESALNMTKVTVTVKWDSNDSEYSTSGIVAE